MRRARRCRVNGSDGNPPEQREERYRVTRLAGRVGRIADETMVASHPGATLRHNAVIRVKMQNCADVLLQGSSAGLNRAATRVVGRVGIEPTTY